MSLTSQIPNRAFQIGLLTAKLKTVPPERLEGAVARQYGGDIGCRTRCQFCGSRRPLDRRRRRYQRPGARC